MTPTLSVVIPSWNGSHLLQQNLPAVVEACATWGGRWDMIVVDDGSDDDTATRIPELFPAIRVVSMGTNRGFQAACNRGIAASRQTHILLLNSDVQLTPQCLAPSVAHFADTSVFAVSMGVKRSPTDTLDPSHIRFCGVFHHGLLASPIAVLATPPAQPSPSFCIDGGCSLIAKDKFLAIDGFDEAFSPMYSEDRDLAYRVLKRGWTLWHEPRSRAYHPRGGSATRRYDARALAIISERNKYLLVWKNITDWRLRLSHALFVGLRLVRSVWRGDGVAWPALRGAFARRREVARTRTAERSHARYTDRDILRRFAPPRGAGLVWFTDTPERC